jgi:hypothetical protein
VGENFGILANFKFLARNFVFAKDFEQIKLILQKFLQKLAFFSFCKTNIREISQKSAHCHKIFAFS